MAGEKILVVDDDELSVELVRDVLEMHGYKIYCASRGQEAIELAREIQPALILMDIELPGMDGFAVTRALQEDSATRESLVVALTAFTMKNKKEEALSAGCIGYITKPINTHQLVKDVAFYLKKAVK